MRGMLDAISIAQASTELANQLAERWELFQRQNVDALNNALQKAVDVAEADARARTRDVEMQIPSASSVMAQNLLEIRGRAVGIFDAKCGEAAGEGDYIYRLQRLNSMIDSISENAVMKNNEALKDVVVKAVEVSVKLFAANLTSIMEPLLPTKLKETYERLYALSVLTFKANLGVAKDETELIQPAFVFSFFFFFSRISNL